MESNLKLSPPWITFVHEVEALFAKDPEVKVRYNSNENLLQLFVDNTDKAAALTKLLPEKKEFGNVVLNIEVVPANNDEKSMADLFAQAFYGNPVLTMVQTYDTPFGKFSYAVFYKEVVQFYNDQMDDINGNKSMLLQDIAKDVFGTDTGLFYCTDAPQKLSKPLGEWP